MDSLYILQAAAYGIVQGATEFLPVSSSGHLVVLHSVLGSAPIDDIAFDVSLHLATLLAVIFFYRAKLWQMARSWSGSLMGKKDEDSRLAWLIILGTIPAVVAGLFLEDMLDVIRQPEVVGINLIAFGIILWWADRKGKKTLGQEGLNWWRSLLIGCGQALAIIPGVSRSGATIISGLSTDLKRETAINFSFLLSIPIILGALVKEAPVLREVLYLTVPEQVWLATAFLSAALSGFWAIKWLLQVFSQRSLAVFAAYRVVLGIIILWIAYVFTINTNLI